jgi:hypothetical protein
MAAAMRKPENRQQQDGVRLPNGQFPPGASGNPGGRPAALSDLRELARQHTPAAVAKLAHIMEKGKTEAAIIAAASALLDRGWGKPTQPVSGDGDMPAIGINSTAVATLTADERATLVASIAASLKGAAS